jgi:hypothetical protein
MNKARITLSEQQFTTWLCAYGKAWEARDANAFSSLFSEAALYYWTPFEEPKKGRDGVAAAFSAAVGKQRDIQFGARVLYTRERVGAAHWSCALTRKRSGKRAHLDGIFVVEFDGDGKAHSFREWWHSDER